MALSINHPKDSPGCCYCGGFIIGITFRPDSTSATTGTEQSWLPEPKRVCWDHAPAELREEYSEFTQSRTYG